MIPGSGIVRLAAKLWYVKTLADREAVPVPRGPARVSSGDPDADRVLLLGNGPLHGWGTVTHELALTGQLARALQRRTGRAADVESVGAEIMSAASAVAWLGDRPLAGFDLVVVLLSVNDALRLTPVRSYRADMDRLLTVLGEHTGGATPVRVVAIPPVRLLPHYRGLIGRPAQRSADRLNEAARALTADRISVAFLQLPALEPDPASPHGSPDLYNRWGEVLAEACAPALRDRPVRTGRGADVAPHGAPTVVERPGDDADVLTGLVHAAKARLGVDLAYVSLIHEGRQYYLANTNPGAAEVPLELSHCRETIRQDDLVVVPNSFRDARFASSPLLDVTQLRFYAGVPLHDSGEHPVGTFCVSSALPRSRRTLDEPLLRQLAAAAQQELQRLLAADAGAVRDAAPVDPPRVPA